MAVNSNNYRIVAVSPNLIQMEVLDTVEFKKDLGDNFTIGSYLLISDDNNVSIIAIVQSYRIKDIPPSDQQQSPMQPCFIVDAQPVGFIDRRGRFRRGGQQITIPPTRVEIADSKALRKIYTTDNPSKDFIFGDLAQERSIQVAVDGDKFFSKHIAVVGSTGSGKSCTVAKILQEGMKPSDHQTQTGILNNSHIVIFDLHGEYATAAFPNANKIGINNLVLPYWLMNSEELEEIFIEKGEYNHHNQSSQFKLAVIENKKKYNTGLNKMKITYDTPVYFSIDEVYRYIFNQNIATKNAKTNKLAITPDFEGCDEKMILFEEIKFKEKNRGEINDGPYAGEFHRFVSRLETKLSDERLEFLLKPRKADGTEYTTDDLGAIVKQFLGYIDTQEANVTVIDLSGIPFEVLSIVVSLISRLVFDFCFYFKRLKREGEKNEVPVLMVYEEAHNYIPNSESVRYRAVRESIERIAKEGRKYGISLMIVSQRPSEISETIFSQCNNFVAMRLTNPTDQNYVKKLLPDNISAITDSLPSLEKQEALIIGDSLPIPTVIRVHDIVNKPDSIDIDFHTEWKKDWYSLEFAKIVTKLKRAD